MKANHKSKKWTYNTRIHEYGHTWQCLLLGPLYWLVVALPSAIWCNCFEGMRKKHNQNALFKTKRFFIDKRNF